MTFDVEFQLDDKTFTLNDTSAAAAEAAAERAEAAVEELSDIAAEIYVDGTTLVINTGLADGNEVSY